MDEKYISLTPKIYDYVTRHRTRDQLDEVLDALREETRALGDIAEMQISDEQGRLFSLLVAATDAKSAIEIGTFTGYSALCTARALPADGRLLCLDASEEWTNVARKYWKKAGLENKIELRLGDAKSTLSALPEAQQFDFAFVDADKTGYDNYYELLLPRMNPNALIIFDNMLKHGKIAEPNLTDESEIAIDALNKKLANDSRVESILLPLADGLNICRVVTE